MAAATPHKGLSDMTAHISPNDLHVLDAEPRIQDLKLAEALNFSQTYDIRQLIKRNAEELAQHGEVFGTTPKTSPNGGRPGTEFWLNEPQSLLVCMFSRTERAAEVRAEIISVFMAWRRGRAGGLPGPIPSTAESIGGEPLAVITAKLGIVRESRLIHGPERARVLWDRLGLPSVPAGPELLADDARACIEHLLSVALVDDPAFGQPRTVRHAVAAALDGGENADAALRARGIRVLEHEDGFVVANSHPAIVAMFAGTRWANNRHPAALRHYPGARKVGPTKFGTISGHRGWLIPGEAAEDRPVSAVPASHS